MKDTVFRKYDIRGKVGSELDLDQMYDLGLSLAYYFLQRKPETKTVAIGMDGRASCPHIKNCLRDAMTDSGLNVVFVGICPSPVLYFSLFHYDIEAGLMVTASHNPKEYNGIKICLDKKMIWGQEVQDIKKIFHEKKRILSSEKGSYTEKNMIGPYTGWLREHFSHLVGMELSAIVDCGNGAAGTVMPHLIKKMEWKNVKTLFEEVDGDYPNHEADPVVEENMRFVKEALEKGDYQVGVGLDGDADRMAPMTKDGQLVTGDKLLAVFAEPILKKYPGSVVVGDIKASSGLSEIIEKWGGGLYFSPSGHSIVKKYMHQYNALLGGELSCHFFFADRHFGYDDGFYAMMRLFEIMNETKRSLKELISVFPKRVNTSEMRIECPDNKKKEVVSYVTSLFEKRPDVTMITIDGVRAIMDYGWGILRESNTQPVISLRMESDTQEGLQKVKGDFYNAMKPYFEENFLKGHLFS